MSSVGFGVVRTKINRLPVSVICFFFLFCRWTQKERTRWIQYSILFLCFFLFSFINHSSVAYLNGQMFDSKSVDVDCLTGNCHKRKIRLLQLARARTHTRSGHFCHHGNLTQSTQWIGRCSFVLFFSFSVHSLLLWIFAIIHVRLGTTCVTIAAGFELPNQFAKHFGFDVCSFHSHVH